MLRCGMNRSQPYSLPLHGSLHVFRPPPPNFPKGSVQLLLQHSLNGSSSTRKHPSLPGQGDHEDVDHIFHRVGSGRNNREKLSVALSPTPANHRVRGAKEHQ
jgi:hypothetical protein